MQTLLLDHFYKIDNLQKEGNTITAQVTFDSAHPIFQGHFPDMPVVPGVCQTQMLGEVLSKAFGKSLQLKNATSIKFLVLVDPNKNPSLQMNITAMSAADGSYQITAQYVWETAVFFKFKGSYSAS